ncbi:NAD(P)-binding protein [Crassisporium funariophilum]|nr:NAD(P)-binding protein [Crassisporium funariophilum]
MFYSVYSYLQFLMSFFARNIKGNSPPKATKSPKALRFGIIGAANIAAQAFCIPAISHPDVIIAAVASRGKTKGDAFAKKHSIAKVYSGDNAYQLLLDDPDIDAVYNPLPNSLHYEWTMKALKAGKHVLLEKPSADVKEETVRMFEYAAEKNLILLEAFHYRFHPSIQRVKAILDSGELGAIKSIKSDLCIPAGLMKYDDIRYRYELGGGGFMDGGGYVISVARYLTGENPTEVVSATPTSIYKADPRIDNGITAVLAFPGNATAEVTCDLQLAGWGPFRIIPSMPRLGVTVKAEGGTIRLGNFPVPHVVHTITVSPKGKPSRTEKHYVHPKASSAANSGEAWWATYRYQLEAFVDKIQGKTPQMWVTPQDSIDNLEWVQKVYEKSGLGSRPASTWVETKEHGA